MALLNWSFPQTLLALTLLGMGVMNDLHSRKVKNGIVLGGLAIGLLYASLTHGFLGFTTALTSFMTALVAVLPLYLMRVFAGGDVKLFLAVSVLLNWQEVLMTLLFGIIWGAILGVVQVVLKGDLQSLLHNVRSVLRRERVSEQAVHKIPFTVAFLFGYLSSLVWLGVQ